MKFYVMTSRCSEAGSAFKSGKSVCVYFETESLKVMYGLGGNESVFENAVRFGLDLSQVDVLILPAARVDSCGSLRRFIKINSRAKIYGKTAVWEEYFEKSALGLSPCGINKFKDACIGRFVEVRDSMTLDTDILLYSTAPSEACHGEYYRLDSRKVKGDVEVTEVPDEFAHEVNVAVVTNSGSVILSESSHSGLKGVLRGAAIWRMLPVFGVIGRAEFFNREPVKSISLFKKELQELRPYAGVRLFLDDLKLKYRVETAKVFPGLTALASGDVIEVR